jgi:site-specific recombinase XerD
MNFTKLIDECLERGLLRRKLVETTVKSYRWHLRRYAAWMLAQGLETPDADNLAQFMDHLQRAKERGGIGFSPRSTRAAWYALRYFDRWLIQNKHLLGSAMPTDYELPNLDDPEIVVMSNSDADLLFNSIEKIEDPFRRAMARGVFSLLATAALRPCEVRAARVSNYDATARTIQCVKSKRGKTRKVGLSDQCCAALDIWLALRPEHTKHGKLFCWDGVRALGPEGLRALMEEVSHAAGFEGREKTHKPRAARKHGASRALKNGEDIDQVRIRLGHSSIKTTQIYLHTDQESLHETRNSTSLNLDPALADTEFQRHIEEVRRREAGAAEAKAKPAKPKQTPAHEKPDPAKDPYLRQRSKLKRTPLK